MKENGTEKIPLKVLYLEDSPQDIEIVRELLADAGFPFLMDCTATKTEFLSLLHHQTYDVILSDFKLPQFDAFGALQLSAEICPEVPFICISGSIGEETAIELIKQGAVDYVLKDRMAKLPLAIKRSLDEAKEKLSRRQAEEELRTSHAFNELLLQAIPFGMDIVDEHGTILFLSNAMKKIIGFDGTGRSCWSVYKDDKKQCVDCPLRKGIPIGRSEILEVSNALNNRIFQINHIGITYQGTNAVLEVFVDVTEQLKLQNQFFQSQKIQSIGTLAGGIAHDFNNILGIIVAYSSLLEKDVENKKKILECSTAINKAVDRGAALVRQILTFARQSDVAFRLVNVPELVHEIISMLKETFPKVIDVHWAIEGKIPLIHADHSQIHQALLNLCVNARDAMPKGGTLNIKVEVVEQKTVRTRFSSASNEHYVLISVSDTGMGIDAKHKLQIFDPFFTTKEKGKGTGLGLSVVYGVMQTHHGFVDLESEAGKGTTFILYLPVPITTDIVRTPILPSESEVVGGTETILLVEDEDDLRTYLQTSLTSKGYRVYTAVDGIDAVNIYKGKKDEIDLVLTDVGLPRMNGIEEFIKLQKINPHVKVILASGFLDLTTKAELFETGVKEFIQKPYKSFEVLTEVRKVLDSSDTMKTDSEIKS